MQFDFANSFLEMLMMIIKRICTMITAADAKANVKIFNETQFLIEARAKQTIATISKIIAQDSEAGKTEMKYTVAGDYVDKQMMIVKNHFENHGFFVEDQAVDRSAC